MRIEVSVPGSRSDRGKLPTPTALQPLTLAGSGAAEPPIRGRLIDSMVPDLMIGAEVCEPGATAHPVSPKTTRRMIIRMTTMVEHYPSVMAHVEKFSLLSVLRTI